MFSSRGNLNQVQKTSLAEINDRCFWRTKIEQSIFHQHPCLSIKWNFKQVPNAAFTEISDGCFFNGRKCVKVQFSPTLAALLRRENPRQVPEIASTRVDYRGFWIAKCDRVQFAPTFALPEAEIQPSRKNHFWNKWQRNFVQPNGITNESGKLLHRNFARYGWDWNQSTLEILK